MTGPNQHSSPRSKNLPRFWLGGCLLIWGFAVDRIELGISLAVLAELGAFLPFKWALSDTHFYRVADASSVVFAGVAVYQFNEHSIYGIYRILALLPMCVFPLVMAERYSTSAAIPLSALFLSLRRRVRAGLEQDQFVGMEYPFVIVCALSASASDMPAIIYLGIAFLMVAGVLLVVRVRRYSLTMWSAAVAACAIVAVVIHIGLSAAQKGIENSLSYWGNQLIWFQTDPLRELTSIGSIGRLKLSDRIRVRIKTPLSTPLPIMLREASYSNYNLGAWSLSESEFSAIDPIPETNVWMLENDIDDGALRTATVIVKHPQDVAVAPLPYGTVKIFGSEVIEVQRNQVGTTLVEALPGQLEYAVSWSANVNARLPPTDADLSVPDNYAEVVGKVATEIGLDGTDPKIAIAKVTSFFHENFKYSLIQKGFYPGRTPLSHFMLQTRKGHCEYFATATALLLRHAGIPTRYAVGYVVDEYSPLEKAFVARARHAHSWTEAFVDNQWLTVDTTPADWYDLEQANASKWQRIQDTWSWISNSYARFQRSDSELFSDSLIWLVPPLVLLLLWRLRSRLRRIGEERTTLSSMQHLQGQDSELYQLSLLLRDSGFIPQPGDTLKSFLVRNVNEHISGVRLARLIELHYQYRFSGFGLSRDERDALRTGSALYCQRYAGSE